VLVDGLTCAEKRVGLSASTTGRKALRTYKKNFKKKLTLTFSGERKNLEQDY
jgi:hypothetical protein